jgi:hypothetical protein
MDAIVGTAADLERERIDYSARRALLPPTPTLLDFFTGFGFSHAAATVWLMEHYACADPATFGWSQATCHRAELPTYMHLLPNEIARTLDSRLVGSAA